MSGMSSPEHTTGHTTLGVAWEGARQAEMSAGIIGPEPCCFFMRFPLLCAVAWMAAVSPLFAEGITIVLDFQGPHSEQSIAEMKREFAGIMKGSTLRFDFRSRSEAARVTSDNLMVVRFKGKCVFEPIPYLIDERGPMAFTYTTDGEVQPFSEVECGRVIQAMRPAMAGGDFGKGDVLLGRALGRVLAHEVVHILSKSGQHGASGVAKTALSGSQLIAPELRLEPEDLERITGGVLRRSN